MRYYYNPHIYDKNQPITIVEALTNFSKIDIDNRVLQIVDHKISFENIYTLDYIISYGIEK